MATWVERCWFAVSELLVWVGLLLFSFVVVVFFVSLCVRVGCWFLGVRFMPG